MASSPNLKPSFSRPRKWGIAFQVGVIVFVVFSIIVMLNYLGGAYFHRFHFSAATRNELSPRTVRLVQSLTNQVKVTIYYDRDEPFFTTIQSLLKEYHYINPKISIETIDYLRDAVAAQRMKTQYKQLVFPTTTNLVIFESGGRCLPLDGNALTKYTLDQVPDEKERVFQKRAVAFEGEKMFTSALLALSNPNPLTAYFLEGHGEHSIMNSDTNSGYTTFAAIAQQNYIRPIQLYSLLGSNSVPADCNLLVIPAPTRRLQDVEVDKIDRYLGNGGRLLVMLNHYTSGKETGLEKLLRKWGIEVSDTTVKDPGHSSDSAQSVDLMTSALTPHPAVNALLARNWSLHFYEPRSVAKLPKRDPAETTKVEEIAFTSNDAFFEGDEQHKRAFPLLVTLERAETKGMIAGSTRMLVAGDSIFLGNQFIETAANRDFAGFALNWLLDRGQLLDGVGQRPIERHQMLLTAEDRKKAEWTLLGGMPGAALLLGGLVWLCRRK